MHTANAYCVALVSFAAAQLHMCSEPHSLCNVALLYNALIELQDMERSYSTHASFAEIAQAMGNLVKYVLATSAKLLLAEVVYYTAIH
jgi:hypothetical protein